MLVHDTVSGAAVEHVALAAPSGSTADVAWAELSSPKTPGVYTVSFRAKGEAIEIPHCNGRQKISVDDTVRDPGSKGPIVFRLEGDAAHEIKLEIKASTYEKRIACSGPPRVGAVLRSSDGLVRIEFSSPASGKGGGEAVVFVPGGHDPKKPATLLVGTHPWNGSPWTYAAYSELLERAGTRDIVLLMPNGLGNSLYVAEAEDEVMRAIDAVSSELSIDRQRVSIWGASMGGAGATTIAFHHPDRFAFACSYFGDSKYDLTTYVKNLVGGEAGARKVNALDVLENARHLPVWLIHGEEDRTSPIVQSTMLYDAMKKAGFTVDFDRVPGMAHEGPLVVKYIRRVVDRAADAVAPEHPARVSFRSVRASDTGAYGVTFTRANAEGDAFVDIESKDGKSVVLLRAEGVREIVLAKGALGVPDGAPIRTEGAPAPVRWAK
jgi:pimeloyl-ACP methyl ester carboxylesterase